MLTWTQYSALHVIQVRKERNQDAQSPLAGLFPFFARWILVSVYLYQQPVILHYHLIPFIFYVGLINAYSVGLIIIAHLTKSPDFPRHNMLTLPLGIAVIDSLGPMLGFWPSVLGDGTYQIAFVFCCLGLAVGVYGSFVVSFSDRSPSWTSFLSLELLTRYAKYDIITTICDFLDIWCLTIKHPYNEKDALKKAT